MTTSTDEQIKSLSSSLTNEDTIDNDSSPAHSTLTSTLPHKSESAGTGNEKTPLSPPQSGSFKKKALLIGIQHYESINEESNGEADAQEGDLKGPHNDVRDMRQLLLDCYGYNPDDITVLIDDADEEHMQPTQNNLIQCMKDLVADARSGDYFYLHFSGHGAQVPDENGDEQDGLDECILTCDHDIIVDDNLNKILVANLPFGSTFVSTFDSCHSGTVLDLAHYRCNRVYVPWVDGGDHHTAFIRKTDGPYCDGKCREGSQQHVERKADVISISASKDYQLCWENSEGFSMTECLIKILRENPDSSLHDIMIFISHELHHMYIDLHQKSQVYKNALNETNIRREKRGKKPLKGHTVETDKFQGPQISSHFPLDMHRTWPLKLQGPVSA